MVTRNRFTVTLLAAQAMLVGAGESPVRRARVARVLLSVVMITLVSACFSCGPGGTDPPSTLTPEEFEARVRDFRGRLEARLLEAEQKGIVNPGEKDIALPAWDNTQPPRLLGYITAISADALSIRTFVSADQQNYFAGDPWTFKFTPETRVAHWVGVFMSPEDLQKGEIVRVTVVQGTMNLESVRGFGVFWP
jgi:hypothetical protein